MLTTAPPEVSAVVRNGLRRLRPPARRVRFSFFRSLSACMTPPAFFTMRCQEDSFRRLVRARGPGFNVASHISVLLYL